MQCIVLYVEDICIRAAYYLPPEYLSDSLVKSVRGLHGGAYVRRNKGDVRNTALYDAMIPS
jgi:hypothetical protein